MQKVIGVEEEEEEDNDVTLPYQRLEPRAMRDIVDAMRKSGYEVTLGQNGSDSKKNWLIFGGIAILLLLVVRR